MARLKYFSEKVVVRFLSWLADLADARAQRSRDKLRQHWRAAAIGGGGTVQLGYMTEAEAIEKLQKIKSEHDPIVYVDTGQAFIAYGRMPDPIQ